MTIEKLLDTARRAAEMNPDTMASDTDKLLHGILCALLAIDGRQSIGVASRVRPYAARWSYGWDEE